KKKKKKKKGGTISQLAVECLSHLGLMHPSTFNEYKALRRVDVMSKSKSTEVEPVGESAKYNTRNKFILECLGDYMFDERGIVTLIAHFTLVAIFQHSCGQDAYSVLSDHDKQWMNALKCTKKSSINFGASNEIMSLHQQAQTYLNEREPWQFDPDSSFETWISHLSYFLITEKLKSNAEHSIIRSCNVVCLLCPDFAQLIFPWIISETICSQSNNQTSWKKISVEMAQGINSLLTTKNVLPKQIIELVLTVLQHIRKEIESQQHPVLSNRNDSSTSEESKSYYQTKSTLPWKEQIFEWSWICSGDVFFAHLDLLSVAEWACKYGYADSGIYFAEMWCAHQFGHRVPLLGFYRKAQIATAKFVFEFVHTYTFYTCQNVLISCYRQSTDKDGIYGVLNRNVCNDNMESDVLKAEYEQQFAYALLGHDTLMEISLELSLFGFKKKNYIKKNVKIKTKNEIGCLARVLNSNGCYNMLFAHLQHMKSTNRVDLGEMYYESAWRSQQWDLPPLQTEVWSALNTTSAFEIEGQKNNNAFHSAVYQSLRALQQQNQYEFDAVIARGKSEWIQSLTNGQQCNTEQMLSSYCKLVELQQFHDLEMAWDLLHDEQGVITSRCTNTVLKQI
ncbi:hypothetical protein RFI_06544, partial [Reticulomyxa filosa]